MTISFVSPLLSFSISILGHRDPVQHRADPPEVGQPAAAR